MADLRKRFLVLENKPHDGAGFSGSILESIAAICPSSRAFADLTIRDEFVLGDRRVTFSCDRRVAASVPPGDCLRDTQQAAARPRLAKGL